MRRRLIEAHRRHEQRALLTLELQTFCFNQLERLLPCCIYSARRRALACRRVLLRNVRREPTKLFERLSLSALLLQIGDRVVCGKRSLHNVSLE